MTEPEKYDFGGKGCCGYSSAWIHYQLEHRDWYRVPRADSGGTNQSWCIRTPDGETIHMTKYMWDGEWRVTVNHVYPVIDSNTGEPFSWSKPSKWYEPDNPAVQLLRDIEAEKPNGWNPYDDLPTIDWKLRRWWGDKEHTGWRHNTPVRVKRLGRTYDHR